MSTFTHGDLVTNIEKSKHGVYFGQSKAIPQRDGVNVHLIQWEDGSVDHVKETDFVLEKKKVNDSGPAVQS